MVELIDEQDANATNDADAAAAADADDVVRLQLRLLVGIAAFDSIAEVRRVIKRM